MSEQQKQKIAHLILRLSLGFAFLYPAINAWFDPDSWLSYFPKFMRGIVSDHLLLSSFGLLEIVIALWIISNRRIFIPSIVATILLISITFFHLNDFQVLFRDVSLAGMALSLAILAFQKVAVK